MKVLIYINKEKDKNNDFFVEISKTLNDYKIDYQVLMDSDLDEEIKADALFVFGGDGTILDAVPFAYKNDIPIITINSGRLGFLAEFQKNELQEAIGLLINGKLKKDVRKTLLVRADGKERIGLNEVVVRKLFLQNDEKIVYLNVTLNDKKATAIKGDGVIVATPTGSTAYALSVGNCVLSPEVNAFCIVPVAPHSLIRNNIIYSADKTCKINLLSDRPAGVFVDGEFLSQLDGDKVVEIVVAEKQIVFLRKQSFDFFDNMHKKLVD